MIYIQLWYNVHIKRFWFRNNFYFPKVSLKRRGGLKGRWSWISGLTDHEGHVKGPQSLLLSLFYQLSELEVESLLSQHQCIAAQSAKHGPKLGPSFIHASNDSKVAPLLEAVFYELPNLPHNYMPLFPQNLLGNI